MNYRDIWIKHHGEIPTDADGISFEIHHIDGNRDNNDISNLQCVSIVEHFNIHLNQGDLSAAHRILTKIQHHEQLNSLNMTPKDLAAFMVEHELGVWSKDSKQKSIKTKQERGVGFCHNFEIQSKAGKIGGPISIRITHQKQKENKTGAWSKEHQSKAGKLGGSAAGKKQKGKYKPIVICPHCGQSGGGQALMNRWHFDNCKLKDQNV